VLLGKGDGGFGAPIRIAHTTPEVSVAAGDFDGDGRPELLRTDNLGGGVAVLLGKGDGTFTAASYGLSQYPQHVQVADLNGDGKLDAVAGCDKVAVLLGKGDGTLQAATYVDSFLVPMEVRVGDVNGDGKADIVAIHAYNASVSVMLGKGDGTF
jgi:hypothetical protein